LVAALCHVTGAAILTPNDGIHRPCKNETLQRIAALGGLGFFMGESPEKNLRFIRQVS
jgi:hypothetical protein